MAGYSARSLVDKLGIKAGMRVALLDAPRGFTATLGRLPRGVTVTRAARGRLAFLHLFATARGVLARRFPALVRALTADGCLWISWPKQASRVATDLTEDVVREIGLAHGLVDVKVCAVDATWSGLKFVRRLADRGARVAAFVGLGAFTTVAAAQLPAHRFRLTAGGGAITGWEEFTVTPMAPGGFRVTGRSEIMRGTQPVELVQTALLTDDRALGHYRLTATVAGAAQTIEAWREADTVRIRVAAGGEERTVDVPATPRTVLLDNLIVSHFQLLLDRYHAEPAGGRDGEWTFVVPQALTSIRGRLSPAGEADGVLDGRAVRVRRYTLEAGGMLVELAATDRGQLLRVAIPVQRVELVRDGYAETPVAAPDEPPPCDVRDVAVPAGDLALPGTLCMPHGTGPVPAVVLVHGSGPNDRDETIGPNKPFRDLAHGLARAGIASLRYDKRTFAHPGRLDVRTLTVEDEVIADAVAAVRLARTQAGIDPARVFVLGHSLGGTLGPLIAERLGAEVRGLILVAPGARPLDSVIVEQTAYRLRVAGVAAAEIAERTAEMERAFARVRAGEAADTAMVLGASALYWRDLFGRRPLDALRRLAIPVLVLQGGKDYQVTRADYERVEAALAGKDAAQAQRFWLPELNHLLQRVAGESTGAEYGRPGRVDTEVIRVIAEWVRRAGA